MYDIDLVVCISGTGSKCVMMRAEQDCVTKLEEAREGLFEWSKRTQESREEREKRKARKRKILKTLRRCEKVYGE